MPSAMNGNLSASFQRYMGIIACIYLLFLKMESWNYCRHISTRNVRTCIHALIYT